MAIKRITFSIELFRVLQLIDISTLCNIDVRLLLCFGAGTLF